MNCYEYRKADKSALRKNITYCTGTGGHIWYGSENPVDFETY